MSKPGKNKKRTRDATRRAPATGPVRPVVWKFLLLRAAVIAAAALWIFWPALHGDWLWDDDWYVVNNPLMNDPARLWKAWFVPGSFVEYYPLEETVQWWQWQLWKEETFGYHLTNVVLHIAGALLVWRLLAKLGLRFAWLGGLLFAIHPAHVESVAWIAELKNTLSLPPFLLAMCAWIDYEREGRRKDYLLALGFFLMAMLCKISMAAFPVVILLYAWWKRGRIDWGDLKGSLPFFAISLVLGSTTILTGDWYQIHQHVHRYVVPVGGLLSHLALAGLALAFYFFECLWPASLLPIHSKWSVDPPALWQFLPWPVFAALLTWCWMKRNSWGRHVVLGLGFFVLNLAPFIGFIAVSYMRFTWVMDHFLYIPMIGLIGLAVAGLGQIVPRLPAAARNCGVGLMVLVMGFLAWESHAYAAQFTSQETLWSYTIRHDPGAWFAHHNLGFALNRQGRTQEAIEQYEEVLRINPDYTPAHINLGNIFGREGRTAEAIGHFEEAIRIVPDNADAHNNLGSALLQAGRLPEAIDHYRIASQINPDNVSIHNNLGNALRRSGRIPEAIEQYERALKINPHDPTAGTQLMRLQGAAPSAP